MNMDWDDIYMEAEEDLYHELVDVLGREPSGEELRIYVLGRIAERAQDIYEHAACSAYEDAKDRSDDV